MEFESLDMAADLNGAGRVDRMRKAGAAIAAENGATAHQLMALFGWTTIKQAEGYTQKANRERLASDAMHLLMPATGERKRL
jgi:hypothetical protein